MRPPHFARRGQNRPPPPPLPPTAALFLDIDGTLAELVDNRRRRVDAAVARRCRASPSLGGALALITGRRSPTPTAISANQLRSPASTVASGAAPTASFHLYTPHPADARSPA